MNYPVFSAGTIFNNFQGELSKKAKLQREFVGIKFPTRLNAASLDAAALAPNDKFIFPAGEIMISIDKPIKVKTRFLGNNNGTLIIGKNTKRKALVNHAYQLMCQALGNSPSLKIDVNDNEVLKHCGFGSSGATIGAVCSSINELYGNPIKNLDLIQYIMGNYGEEVKDEDKDHLQSVPAIGGSVATGLTKGGVIVIAGQGMPIGSTEYHGKVVIGTPTDYKPQTAEELMKLEEKNFKFFNDSIKRGDKNSRDLSYNLVHDALPKLATGDISGLSEIVFNKRFNNDAADIKKCAFLYPRISQITDNIRHLYENGNCEMLSMSSVGPTFFALVGNTDDEKRCIEQFNTQDLKTSTVLTHNNIYEVK